jgi:predicted metal-dependent hydrolase
MTYEIDDIAYDVVIQKKKIKNLYIRFKDNTIIVSVPRFSIMGNINDILDRNTDALRKMIKHVNKNNDNLFLGNAVDIVGISNLKYPEYSNGKIFVKDRNKLDDAYKALALPIFKERLDYIYNMFEEHIPYPTLRIRKMTTRWGVCNRKNTTITLNLELIKYDYKYIDYVITHELSHFVHFNHSASFWGVVSKYCKDYKVIRKSLRE